jgi:hypothetical protein
LLRGAQKNTAQAVEMSIFGYRMSADAVEITLLGFTVRRIPFSNIEDVWLGSRGWGGEIWTVFKLWGLVTIKKKKGLLKYVTIAPLNPEDFVAKLKQRLMECRGSKVEGQRSKVEGR